MQNHLEISLTNSVLDPKRAKIVQKSYGKFTESLRNLQDLSRMTHKGPYGPIRAYKGPYGPIYGPITAHMGPYGHQPGPGPNPDRDLGRRETFVAFESS